VFVFVGTIIMQLEAQVASDKRLTINITTNSYLKVLTGSRKSSYLHSISCRVVNGREIIVA
jgi:hypothetical protein